MAMAQNETPRDNRSTVTLAGIEFEVEASNGACLAYANEFKGKLDKPFTGSLMTDILATNKAIEAGDDAELQALEHIQKLVWAMAFAAGCEFSTYDQFCERLMHESVSYFELADAYRALMQLADRTFFRLPNRPADAGEPDEAQEAE